jgi:hypothetical protein
VGTFVVVGVGGAGVAATEPAALVEIDVAGTSVDLARSEQAAKIASIVGSQQHEAAGLYRPNASPPHRDRSAPEGRPSA